MRGYTFECSKQEIRDKLFHDLYEVIKESNEFAVKDIMLKKWDQLGLFYCGITISDCVTGSFSIITMNAFGKSMKSTFVAVNASIKSTEVLIPDDVKVSEEWREDSVNTYKNYYNNFPFIKAMLNEGATPEQVNETFGTNLTSKECEKILAKDKP